MKRQHRELAETLYSMRDSFRSTGAYVAVAAAIADNLIRYDPPFMAERNAFMDIIDGRDTIENLSRGRRRK